MIVSKSSFTENYYKYYQANQQNPRESPYEQMLLSAARDMKNANEPGVQIWADYKDWKAQQPPRELPESQGATEENMAYLREHFTGELSLFQRIDALDTMREMGILTREQMMDGLGLGGSLIRAGNTKVIANGSPETARELWAWGSFFTDSPILQMDDLERLFQVLDDQLRINGEEETAQHIQSILEKLTRRVWE